jgi:site-specific DNA-methyltransferase (cytosine-N4-specific)
VKKLFNFILEYGELRIYEGLAIMLTTHLKTQHKVIFGDSRQMRELKDKSIHLMITSPPYPMIEIWDKQFRQMDKKIDELWLQMEASKDDYEKTQLALKIYDLMHEYLAEVWRETYRILVDGGIACINIGDATRSVNGMFKLFPNHVRITEHCERIGFVTLPYILWKKPTTKPKYKGKGAFLGSGFLPPNAYVTLDCEYILIFRKGKPREFEPNDPFRYASQYTKEERDSWFTQIWEIPGTRQELSEAERRVAAFPEEIPRRLIRMFSVIGDIILDPFLGTGTTMKVAMELKRNSIGYEIDKGFRQIIEEKIGFKQQRLVPDEMSIEIIERT